MSPFKLGRRDACPSGGRPSAARSARGPSTPPADRPAIAIGRSAIGSRGPTAGAASPRPTARRPGGRLGEVAFRPGVGAELVGPGGDPAVELRRVLAGEDVRLGPHPVDEPVELGNSLPAWGSRSRATQKIGPVRGRPRRADLPL